MEIIINTESETIKLDAEVLQIKAEFIKRGFNNFPSDLIVEVCPYKSPKKITSWMNKAGNVWRGRNRNKGIIKSFREALDKITIE